MNSDSWDRTFLQQAFWRQTISELFRNSIHYPVIAILLLLFLDGRQYVFTVDPYLLLAVALIQSVCLTWWRYRSAPARLAGNLVAPALYTLGTLFLQGVQPFDLPNHVAFWTFALCIGILQELGGIAGARWWLRWTANTGESLLRSSLPLAAYIVFVTEQTAGSLSIQHFLTDDSNLFLTFLILFIGVVLSLNSNLSAHYARKLRETLRQFTIYSEWLLGPTILQQAMEDESRLHMSRVERTIMFMDIRNFTTWAEHRPPELVVSLLNRYYKLAERAAIQAHAIKFKFTGDEVMIVFAKPAEAVTTARALYSDIAALLQPKGLSSGIGIHTGMVAEGLLGSDRIKGYDVIGDTVNTAKRLEGAADGDIIISEATFEALSTPISIRAAHTLQFKGKRTPLRAYSIATPRTTQTSRNRSPVAGYVSVVQRLASAL